MEDKLIRALNNVGEGVGIKCLKNQDHELGFMAKYVDDYLAVKVLAGLIADKKVEIVLKSGTEDYNVNYFFRLLKMEK